ncbi:MAG: glycosyltransferase [Alsobacter sp.]
MASASGASAAPIVEDFHRWAREEAAKGKHQWALRLLDRHHRVGRQTASSRLLEASLLRLTSGLEACIGALEKALWLDPTDGDIQDLLVQAVGRTQPAGQAQQRASEILEIATLPRVIARCKDVLDPGWTVTGSVEADEEGLSGWLAWRDDRPGRTLVLRQGSRILRKIEVAAEHGHDGLRFGQFRASWPEKASVIDVQEITLKTPLKGSPLVRESALPDPAETWKRPTPDMTTIIVPVYGDAQSLSACLASLVGDGETQPRRIILIDDATPDPDVRAVLDDVASDRVLVVRNPSNLGFARSVNRCLAATPAGDVVILNSDVVLPRRWLSRLQAIARDPSVGTITPLSNNGELTSVPVKFRANPIPADLEALNAVVSRLSEPPHAVDLPHGIGFCLYVPRRTLELVPRLSTVYGRGYFEDVDFGLEVEKAGLRNVCATNVVVSHKGTASFTHAKRALIVRNARILRDRWPSVDSATDAYLERDPLRPFRSPLAAEQFRPTEPWILVALRHEPSPWLSAWLEHNLAPQGLIFAMITRAETISIRLPTGAHVDWDDWTRTVPEHLPPARVISIDGAGLQAGWPPPLGHDPALNLLMLRRPRNDVVETAKSALAEGRPVTILAASMRGASFARTHIPGSAVERWTPLPAPPPRMAEIPAPDRPVIGLLAAGSDAFALRQYRALVRIRDRQDLAFDIAVLDRSTPLGQTQRSAYDDLATGPIRPGEMTHVIERTGCTAIVLASEDDMIHDQAFDLAREAGCVVAVPIESPSHDALRDWPLLRAIPAALLPMFLTGALRPKNRPVSH